jgi:type IV pilus assembly protein PilQ
MTIFRDTHLTLMPQPLTRHSLTLALMGLLSAASLHGQTEAIDRAKEAVAANDARVSAVPAVTTPAAVPTVSTIPAVSAGAKAETISLNVDDQEIRVILRNIAELFELNLVVPDTLQGRTSLNLRDVTWQQVFDIVLEQKGYSWTSENGIIRIRVGAKGGDGEVDERVQQLAGGLLRVEFRATPINSILSLVARALDLNVVIPPDEILASELDLRLTNVTWEQVFAVGLSQFGYGYIQQDGIVIVRSLDAINAVPDISRVFQVKYSEAEEIAALLKDQAGVKRVVTDSRSNVVIVTGNPSRFGEIKALIENLDRPTPQVMIESRFVEIQNTDLASTGLDWTTLFSDEGFSVGLTGFDSVRNKDRTKTNRGTDDNSNGFENTNSRRGVPAVVENASEVTSAIEQVRSLVDSTVASRADTAIFSASAFKIALRALKKLNDAKIVSNPTVLALNGQEALIKIVDHWWLQKPGTPTADGRVTPGEMMKLDPLPGIELRVTPTISGGDFISLKVEPQVNDIIDFQQILGQPVPVVRQRTALTQVMVKDRETLAIGGLVDESTSDASSKIPVLGSIPAVGRLFRYDRKEMTSTNQIIFLTANILNPNETNYIDVIGVERLNKLGLTERDVMGNNYSLSSEEQALNEAILRYRRQTEKNKQEDTLNNQLESYRMVEEKRALDAMKKLEKQAERERKAAEKSARESADAEPSSAAVVPSF